jgi:hypothetical protein
MTLCNKDHASFDYLVPLYVKGLLPDAQRREFENALSECPDLKNAIEEWKLLGDAYKALECRFPEPSKNLFPKITEKVKESKNRSFFQRIIPTPGFSLAFMAAQLLIIITLGVYIMQIKHEYSTLSAPSVMVSEPIKINIVFKDKTTETEIRNLLMQIDSRIIDGPYSTGLYIIGIKSGADLEKTLSIIKESKIVAIAEKAY